MVSHLLPYLEKFEEELSRESYLHSSGQKDESESAKIYAEYPHLFSREHITEAFKKINTREGKLLYDAFVGNFMGNELKEVSDEMSSYESSAEIDFEGRKLAFRQASNVLVNEPLREKRKELYESLKPVKHKLTAYEKDLWEKCYALINQLSGKSYLDYVSFVKEVDYDAFAEEKENARYCTTDNECNYTNTIRKGPSQLWCCGIVYSERQGLEGLKEIGELYNSKSCPETKAACDCQDFKYGEFKCIENKCAYVSNFDRPRMKDLWNKCGNGICESEESGYGCDPVFDASECDNHVYCPQDCSS